MISFFKSPFWEAVGVFGGMIIGSGMFVLPYAASVSGLGWTVAMAAIAFFAILSLHLAYGEIVLNTEERHRFPGYVKLYLGKFFGGASKYIEIILFNATLLVYGALAGIFLSTIFGGYAFFWTLAFFAISSSILLFESIEQIGFINFVLTLPLILATLLISFLAYGEGDIGNLNFYGEDPFFVFGVLMFALAGFSAIPDAMEVFSDSQQKSKMKSVIWLGTAIPLVLYIIFIVSVLLVVDGRVSEDAISSLKNVLGGGVLVLGAIIGFLAVFTSYLVLAYDLKRIYELDVGISKTSALLSAAILPALIFIFGFTDLIKTISIIGGLFIVLDGFFVLLILRKIRKNGLSRFKFLPFGPVHQFLLLLIFTASIIYEVVYQIF